jgi:hypothetical protein
MTSFEKNNNTTVTRRVSLPIYLSVIFGLSLAVGIIGYFFTRGSGIRYIFVHLAALTLIGLLADLAAWIGTRRGYPFGKIFLYCFLIPVVLGILVMVPIWITGGHGCGGPVTLAAALFGILIIGLMKRNSSTNPPVES